MVTAVAGEVTPALSVTLNLQFQSVAVLGTVLPGPVAVTMPVCELKLSQLGKPVQLLAVSGLVFDEAGRSAE